MQLTIASITKYNASLLSGNSMLRLLMHVGKKFATVPVEKLFVRLVFLGKPNLMVQPRCFAVLHPVYSNVAVLHCGLQPKTCANKDPAHEHFV